MGAAAASVLITIAQIAAFGAASDSRPLDAPVLFVRQASGAWRSALGSYGVEVDGGGMRVREGALKLSIRFEGASHSAEVVAGDGHVTPLRRFTGSGGNIRAEAAEARQSLRIAGLYPGIDLAIRSVDGRLKTDFIVSPGADPGQIRVRYEGSSGVRRLPGGGLEVDLQGGVWTEDRPVAWQPGGSAVEVEFECHNDGSVGFAVGSYDQTSPLVIDPVLTLSTLLGGQGSSAATAVAVDASGDVYTAGYTDALDFPVVSPLRSRGSGVDAWVVKIRPGEKRILWATCLGGTGDDRAFALALDPAGGVYVAGWTASPDFPVVLPSQPQLAGGRDAFLLKMSPGGESIAFSTFFGGSSVEAGLALAAYSGGVWLAGETMSSDMAVLGAAQNALKGVQDGFLARFNSAGARLSSTYLGGPGEEMIRAAAVDGAGRPYVAGSTESADIGLPAGVFRRAPAGGRDGFILRFNASASAVDSGTYLGGAAGSLATLETVTGLLVDPAGGVVATGFTPSSDFPVVSAWQPARGGDVDGFLTRIASDFTSLTWSTYVGGLNRDTLDGVAGDASGRIYVAGKSISPNFPTAQPLQGSPGGNQDAILMRFPAAGGAPDFSTWLGGTGGDGAVAVAVSAAGAAWVAGTAGATDFPQLNPVVTATPAGVHAFLAGVAFGTASPPAFVSLSPASGNGPAQVFALRYSDASGGGYIQSVNILINGPAPGAGACFISYDRSANTFSLNGNAGSPWSSGQPGAAFALSNRQCDLRLPGSAATVSGTELELRLDLAFKSVFAGAHAISSTATNGSGLSPGWAQTGAWTVAAIANQPPDSAAASPASSGGTRQVFNAVFTDPDGGVDIVEAAISFGHAPSAASTCSISFSRAANRILLLSDDGASWSEGLPGAAATLSNGQCLVRLATSGFNTNGNAWTVATDVEFFPSWAGVKGIFVRASDSAGNLRDWSQSGSYMVGGASGASPQIVSLSPSNGSGGGALFEVVYRDADGSNDIASVAFLIHGAHQSSAGCLITANRTSGMLSLASDNGNVWSTASAGQATQLQNSQCVLKAASSTFTYAGQDLRVRLDIAFKAAFIGSKTIWSHAVDASGRASSPFGWTGTYNVTYGGLQ